MTHAVADYVGSVGIDAALMEAAGIAINEQVTIVNLENGNRWITYAIPAEPGSRIMSLNGGGAFLGSPGDKLVVMTYVFTDTPQPPTVLFFGEGNEVLKVGTTEPHGTLHPDIDQEKL